MRFVTLGEEPRRPDQPPVPRGEFPSMERLLPPPSSRRLSELEKRLEALEAAAEEAGWVDCGWLRREYERPT